MPVAGDSKKKKKQNLFIKQKVSQLFDSMDIRL